MKLIFIRHADPDYEHDSLTEKGWREAKLLAGRMAKLDVEELFVSPLGRAKDTASLTLEAAGKKARECEWLKEFPAKVEKPCQRPGDDIAWDWLPQVWTKRENFYGKDSWYEEEEFVHSKAREEYLRVCGEFDGLLSELGYEREGNLYRAVRPNKNTYVFFCHYGVSMVLFSHLMDVSPMVLWHHVVLPPASLTCFCTEERREGAAIFRANAMGDVYHLYAGGEEPSFSARFCEVFTDDTRHD